MNAPFPEALKSKLVLGFVASLLIAAPVASLASPLPAIAVLRGANQQTTYGTDFPAPLEVWVTDPVTERAMPGVRISFTPGAGMVLSASAATTDEKGLASVTATPLAAGTFDAHAEISGFPEAAVSFEGLVADKAVLTVIPADLTTQQGGSVPAVSIYTITGFVNGDTAETAQIKGLPVLTTTAHDRSPRANYAIKGGVGSLSAANYTFVAGFGTLAVLEGPNGADTALAQETSLNILSSAPASAWKDEEAAAVRSAFLSSTASLTIPEPEFVAGLHGQSGVFVVNAMWPGTSSAPAAAPLRDTRTALPPVVVDAQKGMDSPVRAVEMPKMAPLSAAAAPLASTRSALTPMPVATRKSADAPVRPVLPASEPAAGGNGRSAISGSAIRKAFIPGGTN
jgi:hypothetical protein